MAKIKYTYGSPPIGNYTYIDFIKHLAPVLPADDQLYLYRNSTKWRKNKKQIPLELFRNICHCKSARPYKKVLKNKESIINNQWKQALQELINKPFKEKEIRNAFKHLTKLEGVAVPTASILLAAWNPAEFGVFDYKVLEVLGMPRKSSIRAYLQFHNRLLELKNIHSELTDCTLRQIEFALWLYYTIQRKVEIERDE